MQIEVVSRQYTLKVDSIQLNLYVLNCLVVQPAQKLQSQ